MKRRRRIWMNRFFSPPFPPLCQLIPWTDGKRGTKTQRSQRALRGLSFSPSRSASRSSIRRTRNILRPTARAVSPFVIPSFPSPLLRAATFLEDRRPTFLPSFLYLRWTKMYIATMGATVRPLSLPFVKGRRENGLIKVRKNRPPSPRGPRLIRPYGTARPPGVFFSER